MTLLILCLLYPQVNLGTAWLWLAAWTQEEENLLGPQTLKSVKSYVPRNLDFVGSLAICLE